jgi:hypothetical protein
VWLGPMLVEAGGWSTYWQASRLIVFRNIWSRSVFAAPALDVLSARLPLMSKDIALALGPWLLLGAAIALLRPARRFAPALRPLDSMLCSAAIAFVFYLGLLYATGGYAMSVVLPFFAFALLGAARLVERSGRRAQATAAGVVLGAVLLQLWLPGGHLRGTEGRLGERQHRDQILSARFDAIRQSLSPASTILVTRKEVWEFAFRHVMFYLPEFLTVQIVRDPFILGLGEERPFLTAQHLRVWASGPSGMELARAAPASEIPKLETVVLMQPAQASDALDSSCLALMGVLHTSAGEALPIIRVPEAMQVLAGSGRLYCAPRSP